MVLIVSPNPEFTVRGIRNFTSYIIKDSAVDDMRDSLHMTMGAVTIYRFYVILLCILHYELTKSVLNWKLLYIYFLSRGDSFTATELYLSFYLYVFASYNGVCIVMFMYATQYNFWLYLILEFCSISILCMGYSTTASFLHVCLYSYVCEY